MKSFAPVNEKEFETASQTGKHQITRPIGNHILPSLRGKATSLLTTRDKKVISISVLNGLHHDYRLVPIAA